jgi:hypothetical protein
LNIIASLSGLPDVANYSAIHQKILHGNFAEFRVFHHTLPTLPSQFDSFLLMGQFYGYVFDP